MATMADEDLTPEPDAPERDPDTADMFGDPAPTAMPAPAPARAPASEGSAAYTVIARKYRPRTFEDLYGQEAMVRTLRNAFAAGRIAHAFMLTGVRGVGKTTTARLLARALNFQTDSVDAPSLDLSVEGRHCRAIIEGRHMDVLELDAASRTGVADMRDLLDGVRYAPVEARYKVYIIDEVHMLSTGAFNALLKTLEEPPQGTQFLLVTARVASLLPTIRSRTQRVRFGPVPEAELADWLVARGLDADLGRSSGGSPGFAIRLAGGEEAERRTLREALLAAVGQPLGKLFAFTEAEGKKEEGVNRAALAVDVLEELLRDSACLAQGRPALHREARPTLRRWASALWPGGFVRLGGHLAQARDRLALNVNGRVVLEALLTQLNLELSAAPPR